MQFVEGLLRAGVTWEVIEAATGLTEACFEALKAQLAGSDAASLFSPHAPPQRACWQSFRAASVPPSG